MKKIIALVLTLIMLTVSVPFAVSSEATDKTGTGYAEGQTLITMSTLLTYDFEEAVTYKANGVELGSVNFPAATLDGTDPNTANITAQQGHFILGAEDGISYRVTNHSGITSNKQGKKIGTNTNLPLNVNTKYTISFDVKPSDYFLTKGSPDYIGFVFTGADGSQMDGTGNDSRWKGYGWCASASTGNLRGVDGAEISKVIFEEKETEKFEDIYENYRNEDGYTTVSLEIDGYKLRVYVGGGLCCERTLSPVDDEGNAIDPYATGTLGLYLFSQWKHYGGTADEQMRMKNLVVKAGNVATKKDINLDGENELSMYVDKTQELMVSAYGGTATYSSSNTDVATVDENGKITSHKKGETVITIVAGDKTATCTVRVLLNTLPVETKIKEINEFKANVQGSDSPCGNQEGMPFVPNTALQALNTAIEKAQTDAANATTNDDVTSIVDTLNSAFNTFKATMKIGGHTWDDGEITTQPTVDSKGEKTYTCTVCGETSVESVKELEASEAADDDTADDTEADTEESEGGCGSSIVFGGIALMTVSLCGVSLIGKKKKENK